MTKVAVTGNIGSGKTEFIKFISNLGFCCISSDAIISKLYNDERTRKIILENTLDGTKTTIDVNGAFIAIGHDPATSLFIDKLKMDEENYIITKPDSTETSIRGVFAAGDVKDKIYRQAVTAAGMGCMAALEAEKYIAEN